MLSAHALSTLAGSFSFLPGFISVGSLVELLHARGVPRVLGLLISLTNQLLGVAVNLGIGLLVLLSANPPVLTGRGDAAGPSAEGCITKPVDCREVVGPVAQAFPPASRPRLESCPYCPKGAPAPGSNMAARGVTERLEADLP